MKISEINDRLQLGASVGVIVGLVLVAYELRQERHFLRADLGADTVSGYVDVWDKGTDEVLASVWARSLNDPLNMTDSDHVIMESAYRAIIDELVTREEYLQRVGIFPITEVGFHDFRTAAIIFSSEYGRAWWETNKASFPPEQVVSIERANEITKPPMFADRLEQLKVNLRRELSAN